MKKQLSTKKLSKKPSERPQGTAKKPTLGRGPSVMSKDCSPQIEYVQAPRGEDLVAESMTVGNKLVDHVLDQFGNVLFERDFVVRRRKALSFGLTVILYIS